MHSVARLCNTIPYHTNHTIHTIPHLSPPLVVPYRTPNMSAATETSEQGSSTPQDAFIRTAAGVYVSRRAVLHSAANVHLQGRNWIEEGVVLDGTNAQISVGRYTAVEKGTKITPPPLLGPSSSSHAPVRIGAHTHIGHGCQVEAAAIGTCNSIGENCVIGARCILKDAVVVAPSTHVPPDTVIPPFTRVWQEKTISGESLTPRLLQMPLSPATMALLQDATLEAYEDRTRLVAK